VAVTAAVWQLVTCLSQYGENITTLQEYIFHWCCENMDADYAYKFSFSIQVKLTCI